MKYLLAFTILTTTTALAFAGEAEIARFEREYPEAVKLLDARFSQVRGTCRLWRTSSMEGPPLPYGEAHFAIDRGFEKVEEYRTNAAAAHAKRPPSVFVQCVGPDMAFSLSRPPTGETYTLTGNTESLHGRTGYVNFFGELMHAHHGVFGRPMSEIMESKGFRVLEAKNLSQDGRALLQVTCEFLFGSPSEKDRVTLVLDPDAGWLIRSYEYGWWYDPGSSTQCSVDYMEQPDGSLLPRHVTLQRGGGSPVRHCEFTEWTFAPTPESEFRTSHYGLPDLVSARSSRLGSILWLISFALLALCLGLFLRWYANRRGASLTTSG